jgi:hypothetical protein
MTIICSLLFRAFLLVTLIGSYVFLTHGKKGSSFVHSVRKEAWNDLITQIKFVPADSPEDSIDKEIVVMQRFLKAHEAEVRVDIYDLEVFKAIDRARPRLQKANGDLETLRNELSYKEEKAKLGR